jgi:thiol-disulfide isomerase/thioredoxin
MTPIFCAAVVHTALSLFAAAPPTETPPTETPESYAEARRVTDATGKPMVIMVGTDWCPPCQTMKRTVLPRLRERGLFRKVAFAVVNPDRDGKLAEEITGGGPVPQLVMFRKTSKGWMRRKLIGAHSVEEVEQFIAEGLALSDSEAKDSQDKDSEEQSG